MNYELPIGDDMSKDVYNLSTFDVEWSGQDRTFDRMVQFLQMQCTSRALTVCTETVTGQEERKGFDRGYIKGIYETYMFLKKSVDAGRRLQNPGAYQEVPPKIV